MEIVNTLDIDGTQWELQDVEARNKIATIEDFLTPETLPDITITLKDGYSAKTKVISGVQKYGKLHMGLLFIDNLSGSNIGSNQIAEFGKVNISLNASVHAVGIEYLSSSPVRVVFTETGTLSFYESQGTTSGNNRLRIPITWIEA